MLLRLSPNVQTVKAPAAFVGAFGKAPRSDADVRACQKVGRQVDAVKAESVLRKQFALAIDTVACARPVFSDDVLVASEAVATAVKVVFAGLSP